MKLVRTLRGMRLPPGYNNGAIQDAADEIERLTAERDALQAKLSEAQQQAIKEDIGWQDEMTKLEAENDALLEALQTIKERCGKPEFVYMTARAAIDAARSKL